MKGEKEGKKERRKGGEAIKEGRNKHDKEEQSNMDKRFETRNQKR